MKTIGYMIMIFFLGLIIFKEDKEYKEVVLPLPELRTYNIDQVKLTSPIDSIIDNTEKNLKYLKHVKLSN